MVEQVLQDNLSASPKHLLDRLNYNYNSHLLFHWGMKNAWNIVQATRSYQIQFTIEQQR